MPLHLDWETRSAADLRAVGLYKYARDPSTDLWCAAYAFGDEEPLLWLPSQPCPPRIVEHIKAGGEVHAWNAPFEIEIWQQIATPRYGWPTLAVKQAHCVMARAYAMGLPGALAEAAPALGVHVLKDNEGHGLMLRMSRPRKVVDGKPIWWNEPEKLARLYAYCQQDVRVEQEMHRRLVPLQSAERRVWLMDYAINQRGVMVDVESAKAAVLMADTVKEEANAEIAKLTAGAVQSLNALIPLKEWLQGQGAEVDSLAKQSVVDLLGSDTLTPAARRVLALRQEAGKASTAKLAPLIERAGPDNRLRSVVQYHGAATGRWAGRGVQVHNLPRNTPPAETVEKILGLIRQGRHDVVDAVYGPPLSVLSNCLRGFFVAPPGKVLVAGDFANVEGRGVAWISGEEWKLRAFRDADAGTGPGLYELAYAKSFGVPVEQVTKEQRQIGKVEELAFGFGGGVGAFSTMGRLMGVDVEPAKADEFKVAWRAAHPRTVATWRQLQDAAINAVRSPGQVFEAGHPGRQVRFKTAGSFLWCRLPSGRCLCYPYPKVLESSYGGELTYMTVPSQQDNQKGKVIDDPQNSSKWARVGTYGGSLMENVVQALCRDLLVHCMLAMHNMGAQIVLHVHDEIVAEVEEAKAERAQEAMQRILRQPPEWAKGFPLYAECSVMRRYGE